MKFKKSKNISLPARARYVTYLRLTMALEQIRTITGTSLAEVVNHTNMKEARVLLQDEADRLYSKLKENGYL